MARAKKIEDPSIRPKRPPAKTPEARERQMIALAVDLAEQQLLDGSASAQVITHYLKLADPKEPLLRERLARENTLLEAKQDQIRSQQNSEEMYQKVIDAMRRYSGSEVEDDYYED